MSTLCFFFTEYSSVVLYSTAVDRHCSLPCSLVWLACVRVVFSGNILETMNRTILDKWKISDHLDAFYTPYLGTAMVRVLDASTHQPVPNATAVVVYGSSTHVTRKISDSNGSFSFGGWVGRARPVPHSATVSARGYETLTKVVAVRARRSTSTVLYLTVKNGARTTLKTDDYIGDVPGRPPSVHYTVSAGVKSVFSQFNQFSHTFLTVQSIFSSFMRKLIEL